VPQKCDKALLFCQELYESYSTWNAGLGAIPINHYV
jgi:hypothetical protein